MTGNTNRNNVKRFRIIGMVILLCLCATRTGQGTDMWHLARSYCIMDSIFCFHAFGVFQLILTVRSLTFIAACMPQLGGLALLGFSVLLCISRVLSVLLISQCRCFATRTKFIGFHAILAFSKKPINRSSVFVKLRNVFNFLAFRALLCYACLRHVLFLYKRIGLEPVTAQTATGSLYFTILPGDVK